MDVVGVTLKKSSEKKKKKKRKKKSAKHCASIAELKGDMGQLSYLISKGWKRLKSERQEGRESFFKSLFLPTSSARNWLC
jgi:hypothetical protein